jgi:hypothetical protein
MAQRKDEFSTGVDGGTIVSDVWTSDPDGDSGSGGFAGVDSQSTGNDSSFTDPTSATGTGDGVTYNRDGTPRKRRGRKPGTANAAKSATKTALSVEKMLFSLHSMGSVFLKIPELEIDHSEAKQLAVAIADVTALYDVAFVNEKAVAWFDLLVALGAVYGTRMVVVTRRVKQEKDDDKKGKVPFVPLY